MKRAKGENEKRKPAAALSCGGAHTVPDKGTLERKQRTEIVFLLRIPSHGTVDQLARVHYFQKPGINNNRIALCCCRFHE